MSILYLIATGKNLRKIMLFYALENINMCENTDPFKLDISNSY